MTTLYQTRLELLGHSVNQRLLRGIRHGIEREGLRVSSKAELSLKAHPEAFGKALTHPYITTDFSESLLEYITPVYCEVGDALAFLEELHRFSAQFLGDEFLWAGSMPCILGEEDSIPEAEYGISNIGQMKSVYRRGLSHRYGKAMQTIAGVHYNFSVPEDCWPLLSMDASSGYLALIRNFRRYSWLLMYLFGASPAVSKSFFHDGGINSGLQELDQETLFLPYATSLRMSDMGYTNNAQLSLNICYNTLDEYIESLWQAIHTPYQPYEHIGVKTNGQYRQLNTNLLQIENEYYSTIRPKRVARSGEKPITALRRGGVEYVEVRCVDINPFEPLGISREDADFIDIFLLYCMLHESTQIEVEECRNITYNFAKTVIEGRRPGVQLKRKDKSIGLFDWGIELLNDIESIAEMMDSVSASSRYSTCLLEQKRKLENAEITPSARVLDALGKNNLSYTGFMAQQSQAHQAIFKDTPLSSERLNYFLQVAEQSRQDQKAIEDADSVNFDVFLQNYQSVE